MSHQFNLLRKKHPKFYYHKYSVEYQDGSLKFYFYFEIEPGIHFTPEVIIRDIDERKVLRVGQPVLDNIAFHLGLMEIPSYWKAACPPEICILAGNMDDFQLSWWHDLMFKGMCEFFYKNNIDINNPDLFNFNVSKNHLPCMEPFKEQLDRDRYLAPIGGGKDSAVSYELLKQANKNVNCWSLNPAESVLSHFRINQDYKPIIVTRNIDKTLLDLNKKGYLNGHTPFSAYLAFASTTCAILFNLGNVAFSNERSSNEGNVYFKGTEINHQYSKSFDFEKRFRDYSSRYLADTVNYFSVLRPLYELQIAKIFSGFSKYFSIFLSCNNCRKTNAWCHKCAKCLFVFTILYPFVEDSVLAVNIFSKNLFDDEDLVKTAFDLMGNGNPKPFECVGTKEETLAAFYLCIKKAKKRKSPLPIVLQLVDENIISQQKEMETRSQSIMQSWNSLHTVPCSIENILRNLAVLGSENAVL